MSKEKSIQTDRQAQIVPPKADEKNAEIQKIIYVGPAVAGLKPFTIFKGGLPVEGEKLINIDPKYKRLFIPIGQLANAIKEIKDNRGLGEIYKAVAGERF